MTFLTSLCLMPIPFHRYLQLLGLVPTDPHIHQRLGQIFDSEGDKQQAYQYYFDVGMTGMLQHISRLINSELHTMLGNEILSDR